MAEDALAAAVTMPEIHDVNFCFPVRELENDHVKLTPFIVSATPLLDPRSAR